MKILSLLLSVGFGILMFSDFKRRGYSPFLAIGAVLIGLVVPILIIPIYLVLHFLPFKKQVFSKFIPKKRPQLSYSNICSKCGTENSNESTHCSQCHNHLRL